MCKCDWISKVFTASSSALYAFPVFLRALKMSTGENAIEESVIALSSCLTNSFDLPYAIHKR